MASKVEVALEQEIAELRAVLAATPEAQRLSRLVQMLELYRGAGNIMETTESRLRPLGGATSVTGQSGRTRSPQRQAVIDATIAFLRAQPRVGVFDIPDPVRTITIYEHLKETGVAVPGSNPQNNLSAMLSAHPAFRSHGREGWTLRENTNPADAETQAEPASAGLNDPAQGGEARPGGGTS